MKELLNKLKNKKVLLGIIGVVLVIAITIAIVFMMNKSSLKLKQADFSLEYGNPISTDLSNYLDLDNDNKEDILKKAKLIANIKNEENKEYPAVGEYDASIQYDKEEVKFKIIVKDTTAPEFKDFKDTVETVKDVKPDYTKLYTAEDLSQVTISADDTNVKYDIVGEYKATIKVTDTSKNETSKEITVKITEPTIKLNEKSKTLYVKENLVLKAEIKGKDDKATFKSSNDKVATVDANGKVTAKSKGTATITASANGVKAECKITVKNVPSGSSTEKKTVTNPNTGKKEEVVVVKPSGGSSSGSGNSSSGSTQTSSPKTSREAFNLINAERQKLGLEPAVWDSECERIALIRAKQLTEDFSHDKFYTDFQNSNHKLGEVATKLGSNNNPTHAVNNWFNSSAHKNILMTPNYTKIAVAYCGNCWVAINSR